MDNRLFYLFIYLFLVHRNYLGHAKCACGEGNATPLQCSCLENPTDEGAW